MANLDPVADKAVHDAVDAFMEGRRTPPATGAISFETRNSRYRLEDGVIRAAPDPSLMGAELVGWLMEQPGWSSVEPMWQPGARAVLVDRYRGRNIIVTSTTRLVTSHPPPPMQAGSGAARPLPPPALPPRAPLPSFARQVNAPEAPAGDPEWWVTSVERAPSSDAPCDDALHRAGGEDAPESRGDTPIPLVRPIDPREPGGRRSRP